MVKNLVHLFARIPGLITGWFRDDFDVKAAFVVLYP